MKIRQDLPNDYKLGVVVNELGEITIHIQQDMTSPIKTGNRVLSDTHSSWYCIDTEIVKLIEIDVKNKNKWVYV